MTSVQLSISDIIHLHNTIHVLHSRFSISVLNRLNPGPLTRSSLCGSLKPKNTNISLPLSGFSGGINPAKISKSQLIDPIGSERQFARSISSLISPPDYDILSVDNPNSLSKSECSSNQPIDTSKITSSRQTASKLYSRSRSVESSRRAMGDLPNPASNQNSPKRSSNTSEYRAAYNWPAEKLVEIAATPAAGSSTGTINLNGSAKKSMTISDFNEIRCTKSKGPHVLFQKESPPPEARPVKQVTEYKNKYKPFSRYVYVSGYGWKKSKDVRDSESANAVDWYAEVAERIQKANEFRSRSEFGHPVVSIEHLEEIYRETPPNSFTKDRSIAALALATTQLRIQESRAAREGSKSNLQRASHLSAIISPQKDYIPRKQPGESWSCPIHHPFH